MPTERLPAREVLNRAMSEDQLLQAIVDAAIAHGWLVHHVRRSDKALQMGHAGFPDICAARKGRVLFLELKNARGRVTPDQRAWLDELWPAVSPQFTSAVIRPDQLDSVLRLLR